MILSYRRGVTVHIILISRASQRNHNRVWSVTDLFKIQQTAETKLNTNVGGAGALQSTSTLNIDIHPIKRFNQKRKYNCCGWKS